MRYELSDREWSVIKPMLPNKPRGIPRVDDRRVLNGIFWALRSGAPWRDLPEIYGPRTTCYNRFVRWRRAGVWDQIMEALAATHDAPVQMIDTSVVRVHQHGACIAGNREQLFPRRLRGASWLAQFQTAFGCRQQLQARLPRGGWRRSAGAYPHSLRHGSRRHHQAQLGL